MKRLLFPILPALLLALPFTLSAQTDEEPPTLYVDGVIVVVNDEIVTLGDVNQEILRMLRMMSDPEAADESALRDIAVRSLVNRRLLAQYAEKEDIEIDEAGIEEMVAERVEEFGGEAALIRAVFPLEVVTREGLSIENVKREFRIRRKIREVVHRKTSSGIFVTPQRILEYYEANKGRWILPERVRFREIEIIHLPEGSRYRPDNYRKFENAAAAKKFTEQLLEQLKEGEKDLEKAAGTISMSPWNKENGLRTRTDGTAWHTGDDLKNFMVEFLFDGNTKDGQVSGVIRGDEKDDGEVSFYILKLEERQPAGHLSFEDAQDEINARIVAGERAKRRDALLRQIHRDAFIYPEKFRQYSE